MKEYEEKRRNLSLIEERRLEELKKREGSLEKNSINKSKERATRKIGL
jgi:hypothetical protein